MVAMKRAVLMVPLLSSCSKLKEKMKSMKSINPVESVIRTTYDISGIPVTFNQGLASRALLSLLPFEVLRQISS